jgi:hypothetical protein
LSAIRRPLQHKILASHVAFIILLGLGVPPLVAQGRVEGRVVNGTTGKPVAGLEVRLLTLRQGMQHLGDTTTDSAGRFVFAEANLDPNAFYLVQTTFQNVAYPTPLQIDSTGSASVNLTVYDADQIEPPLRIASLHVLVRAEGRSLLVQQEYVLENPSRPPRAYLNPSGTFRFRVSPLVEEPQVAVRGLMNIPLPQTAEPGLRPGEFSIRHPLLPGPNTILVAYQLPYSRSRASLESSVEYPIERAELHVLPTTLNVESAAFVSRGIDPANRVQRWEAANVIPGTRLEASFSGQALPASSEDGQGGVQSVPSIMSQLGLPLLACFLLLLLWALGVRVAKEWPRSSGKEKAGPTQKELEERAEALFNSLADLDELFAAGKIAEKNYWKERLELKARLVAVLKKSPALLESYAARRVPR